MLPHWRLCLVPRLVRHWIYFPRIPHTTSVRLTYYSWEATVLWQKAPAMSDCSDTIQAGLNRSFKDIDQESLVRLMRYHSPGNVHQLENKIVRMDTLSQLAVANRRACVSGADLFLPRRVTSRHQKTRTSAHSADPHPTDWHVEGPDGRATRLGLSHRTVLSQMKWCEIIRSPIN